MRTRDDIFEKYTEVPSYGKGAEEAEKQFRLIKDALDQVARFDNMIVPKPWLESFPEGSRASMGSIGEHLDPEPRFFPAGKAFANLGEYRDAHQQTYRVFTATLDYLATGEGRTLKVFAHLAHSLGEFIATIDDDPYFIQGMTFYEGIPPSTDAVFKAFETPHVRALIGDTGGNLRVKLETHINYS